jgi:hypothetical protein
MAAHARPQMGGWVGARVCVCAEPSLYEQKPFITPPHQHAVLGNHVEIML